jgi:hypothetical protein
MLGNPREHYGVLRSCRIEVRRGGILPCGEVTLIPAAANDPVAGRRFLRDGGHSLGYRFLAHPLHVQGLQRAAQA